MRPCMIIKCVVGRGFPAGISKQLFVMSFWLPGKSDGPFSSPRNRPKLKPLGQEALWLAGGGRPVMPPCCAAGYRWFAERQPDAGSQHHPRHHDVIPPGSRLEHRGIPLLLSELQHVSGRFSAENSTFCLKMLLRVEIHN